MQATLSETLSKWKTSMIRELLPRMIETYSFGPKFYLNILQFGRQLEDAKFLHHLLKKVVTSKRPTPKQVLSMLCRVSELKDTIPTGELQTYCKTIVSSGVCAIKEYHVIDMSSVSGLLERSLPLAEDATRKCAVKALRTRPTYNKYQHPEKELVKSMTTISDVLGEQGLLLLLPPLSKLAANIPWLITLLTRTAEIDIWKSEPFLTRFCAEVLEPAVVLMELHPALEVTVRNCNQCDSTVAKEEVKLFIKLLKDLGLEKVVDQLTNKMAQFGNLGVNGFCDVLGDGKVKGYANKRKAVEVEEERSERKGRLSMKDGKLFAAYN
jgi:hypothetical protein